VVERATPSPDEAEPTPETPPEPPDPTPDPTPDPPRQPRPVRLFFVLWVLLSTVGWVVGVGLTGPPGNVAGWVCAGALLGILQTMALAAFVPRLGGWVVACAIGVGVAGLIESDDLVRWGDATVQRGPPAFVGGHSRGVLSIAVSADGTRVLTGGQDGISILWDLATGKEIRVFEDRPDDAETNPVAISPDGFSALTGGYRALGSNSRGVARLWEVETGRRRLDLPGLGHHIDAVAFSPDGTTVAVAGGGSRGLRDGVVQLWDVATGTVLRTMQGSRRGAVSAIAFSPDGTRLVTGSGASRIDVSYPGDGALVWDVATGQTVRSLLRGRFAVNGVAYSADGTRIVTAGADEVARVWDAETGAEIASLEFDAVLDSVSRCAISPDGAHLALPDGPGAVAIWSIEAGSRVHRFPDHGHIVTALAYTPDGGRLLVGSSDHVVRIWDTATGEAAGRLTGREVMETAELGIIGPSRHLRIGRSVVPHFGPVSAVAWSPDGRHVISAGEQDGVTVVWNARSGSAVRELRGHGADKKPVGGGFTYTAGGVHAVAFGGLGATVLTGGWPETVRVRDIETGVEIETIVGHGGLVTGVGLTGDGRRAVIAGGTTAHVRDLATGRTLVTITDEWGILRALLSPDGTRVLTLRGDGVVRVWDAATGAPLRDLAGHDDLCTAIAFSPDSSFVATASRDRTAIVWDLATGAVAIRLVGHERGLRAVAFGPGGRRLATVGDGPAGLGQGVGRIWDIGSGVTELTFASLQRGQRPGERGAMTAVAFSPDGRHLVTGDTRGAVRIWDARTGTAGTLARIPWHWAESGFVIGLLIGVMQLASLVGAVPRAGWWIIGSAFGWGLAAMTAGVLGEFVADTVPAALVWVAAGGVYGIVSGVVLVTRLRAA
jgi:WD40 repeat protein